MAAKFLAVLFFFILSCGKNYDHSSAVSASVENAGKPGNSAMEFKCQYLMFDGSVRLHSQPSFKSLKTMHVMAHSYRLPFANFAKDAAGNIFLGLKTGASISYAYAPKALVDGKALITPGVRFACGSDAELDKIAKEVVPTKEAGLIPKGISKDSLVCKNVSGGTACYL